MFDRTSINVLPFAIHLLYGRIQKALTGGSIYVPAFFNASESEAIFNALMKELSDYAK